MEGTVAVGGFFGASVFMVWALLHTVLRWREISRETQVMTQLVAQVRTGEEAVAFLESSSARALFERLADRRTLVLERMLRAVQSGIVLVVLGIAVFVVRTQLVDDDDVLAALVFGTLSTALGIALFLAGGATYALSHRWGLLKDPS